MTSVSLIYLFAFRAQLRQGHRTPTDAKHFLSVDKMMSDLFPRIACWSHCPIRKHIYGTFMPPFTPHSRTRPCSQSRLCLNSVRDGNFQLPKTISSFVQELYSGFRLLNLRNDNLRRRFDGIKYDVQRIEVGFQFWSSFALFLVRRRLPLFVQRRLLLLVSTSHKAIPSPTFLSPTNKRTKLNLPNPAVFLFCAQEVLYDLTVRQLGGNEDQPSAVVPGSAGSEEGKMQLDA